MHRHTSVRPAPVPEVSEKVLPQTASPDKNQMTEKMKLFTASHCDSSFPACISEHYVLAEPFFSPIFVFF